jgi:hypothetical protein
VNGSHEASGTHFPFWPVAINEMRTRAAAVTISAAATWVGKWTVYLHIAALEVDVLFCMPRVARIFVGHGDLSS